METKKPSLVLTGGGTAGHVWPHFALFEESESLLSQQVASGTLAVHYIGSEDGMEKDLVKGMKPEWTYHSISTGKLRRYFSFQNFLDPFLIILGVIQAFFLLGKIHCKAVFSKGGFVSAPVVWAAWLRGIPIVIHESDATPALATKLSLPFCQKALLSFSETKGYIPPYFRHKLVETGLPVRASLFTATREEGLNFFNFPHKERKTILIFGGSLGARSLNHKMFEIIPDLIKKYNVIHIVGRGNAFPVAGLESEIKNYLQFEFLREEMRYAYAVADLAICRAGASSIFELAAAGIPMILIPLGIHASRGDQIINARIFSGKGWADWLDEKTFHKDGAVSLIEATMSSLEERKRILTQVPARQAALRVAAYIDDALKGIKRIG